MDVCVCERENDADDGCAYAAASSVTVVVARAANGDVAIVADVVDVADFIVATRAAPTVVVAPLPLLLLLLLQSSMKSEVAL